MPGAGYGPAYLWSSQPRLAGDEKERSVSDLNDRLAASSADGFVDPYVPSQGLASSSTS